jgi:L-ascorbate metabolism protein UlaG (beta-lactamase superfamily)
VAAAHEEIERDARGHCLCLGYVVARDGFTVFHAGDTLLHDGLAAGVRPHAPDVALLPINGRDPARGVAGNLDGPEAARLARDVGAGLAIPCHYDLFAFNTAAPDAFRAEAERIGQPYRVLELGARVSVPRSPR